MPDTFEWIQGDSVVELTARLNGIGPEHARLEWRIHDKKTYFRVVDARPGANTFDGESDINNSHICPIDCPG